jgi:solute carrier family 50 protein (sugar transporter)
MGVPLLLDILLRTGGPACFLSMQASSFATAMSIRQKGTTGKLSPIPFFSLFLNCIVWSLYGILKRDSTVFVPNFIGCFVGGFCSMSFHINASTIQKSDTKIGGLLSLYALGAIVVLTSLSAFYFGDSDIIGSLGVLMAISTIGAPLSTMATVLRDKSTESMPFWTSVSAFLNWYS